MKVNSMPIWALKFFIWACAFCAAYFLISCAVDLWQAYQTGIFYKDQKWIVFSKFILHLCCLQNLAYFVGWKKEAENTNLADTVGG